MIRYVVCVVMSLAALVPATVLAQSSDQHATVSAAPGKGITVRSGDAFAMTLRARLQMRDTASVGDKTTNELNMRTLRLITQGNVLDPELHYSLQLAFGPADFDASSATPIFDAFVEYRGLRDLQLRAGQYFVPLDRARTIREFALQLADRQQVVGELNLDRDVGVMIFSQDLFGLSGKLAYHLGVFGGSGGNRVGAESPGFLYVGRIGYRPFGAFDDDVEGDLERRPKPRLAVGIAAAYNQDTNRERSTLGSTYKLWTFDYKHGAVDVVFKFAGFSFLGEALYRRAPTDFRDGLVDGTKLREWSRSGGGYVLQAGLMLTQKLEVAGRWDELFAFGNTAPAFTKLARQQGREAGGGLNLYLNGHLFKLQGDYALRFGDGSAAATQLVRLLVDASF